MRSSYRTHIVLALIWSWAVLNWVERRKKKEENLAADIEYIWRDVKQALEDATRSFNAEYEGTAEALPVNGHRFRIVLGLDPTVQPRNRIEIDIDFDVKKREVKAESASPSVRHLPAYFTVCADHEAAFLCDSKNQKVTADDFSRIVLEPIFFPAKKANGGWRTGRLV